MELCQYCIETILESKESWDYHKCDVCVQHDEDASQRSANSTATAHETAAQKTAAAAAPEGRCLFCSTLREDVETLAPDLRPLAEYRWTIRSLSRIRESLETVVVTFHPVPPPSASTAPAPKGALAPTDLPTRTFYFFPEADLGPLPTPSQLGGTTDPAKNGGTQIKSWLTTCNETHTGCMKRRKAKSGSKPFVPTRLLDIRGAPGAPMRVVETTKTEVRSPYATLSHCWGPREFVRLLRTTEKQFVHEEGVPWDWLTKNFQQAVEVARVLEIEYIWIDSLCIVQGDNGDFAAEGALMHQVYRNSYCNIAIVDSEDEKGGLYRKRNPEDVAPVRYQPPPRGNSAMFGSKTWRVLRSDLYESELLKTKLYGRGWVFQGKSLTLYEVYRLLISAKNVCWRREVYNSHTGKCFGTVRLSARANRCLQAYHRPWTVLHGWIAIGVAVCRSPKMKWDLRPDQTMNHSSSFGSRLYAGTLTVN